MSPGAVVRGNLAEVGYADLIRRLDDEGFSGALLLEREGIVKTSYFREGRLIFARSTEINDRLGEFLLRQGLITLPQYLESSARITPSKRQGAILCEMGAISAEDLARLVKEQVSEILYTLFAWATGTFEIRPDEGDTDEMIVLNLGIEDVILQGTRRVSDWSRIWQGLGGSLEAVLAPTRTADSLGYRASLSEDEGHVLSLVNGRLPLGRILDLGYASHFATCRTLWGLLSAGVITRAGGAEAVPADSLEDYALAEAIEAHDRVLTFIHTFVTERIGDLVDHFMDRAVELAAEGHPEALAQVHLRNQGRVEYEQVLANLSRQEPRARLEAASGALGDLIGILLRLTAKELGPEEEGALTDQLGHIAGDVPLVPLAAILARHAHKA